MANRYYSNTAVSTTLVGAINNAVTSLVVGSVSGFPVSCPYTLVLDQGTPTEELVTVTAAAGTTLTVTRGSDGTAAAAHSAGATVKHAVSAQDFREPQDHMVTSSGTHGITGSVVGTTDAQNLTNKTMNGASNSFSNIPSAAIVGLDAHTAATAAHGATGAVVGTTNVQTLTGKTLTSPVLNSPSIANPSFTGTATTGLALAGALTGVSNITASGTVSAAAVTATGALTGASASISGGANIGGQVSGGSLYTTGQVLCASAGGEITLGYGGSGGLAIAQGNVATHANGIVLWVSGNSLYARKANGNDVLIVP